MLLGLAKKIQHNYIQLYNLFLQMYLRISRAATTTSDQGLKNPTLCDQSRRLLKALDNVAKNLKPVEGQLQQESDTRPRQSGMDRVKLDRDINDCQELFDMRSDFGIYIADD